MMTRDGHLRSGLLGVGLCLAGSLQAAAQTDDGMEAMKRLCVVDYFRLCEGMDPGGDDVRRCFEENRRRLSQGCRDAIDAYHRRGAGDQ